jgi:hypothetical protein
MGRVESVELNQPWFGRKQPEMFVGILNDLEARLRSATFPEAPL